MMRYQPFVSMGVMNADNPQLVRAALGAGIIHLDTTHLSLIIHESADFPGVHFLKIVPGVFLPGE